jgi:hypothetical protein
MAVAALVLATVVVVLALRDRIDAVARFGGVLSGLDLVLLGAALSGVAALVRVVSHLPRR